MMNRYALTLEGYSTQPKIYADTQEAARSLFSDCKVLEIKECDDIEYLSYIIKIKEKSNFKYLTVSVPTCSDNGNDLVAVKEYYDCKFLDGILEIELLRDSRDNRYFDFIKYRWTSKSSLVVPVLWSLSNPKELYHMFFAPVLTCEIPIYRFYGQPKMKKPDELKGIKPSFSVDWIPKKCTCECFIKDNDLWIKHRDFFSTTHKPDQCDIGTPLSYRLQKYFGKSTANQKFIYDDNWGLIVLRNEAWIVFRNLKNNMVKYKDCEVMANCLVRSFLRSDLLMFNFMIYGLDLEWTRFFEQVSLKYIKEVTSFVK